LPSEPSKSLEPITKPSKWPSANARLLDLGAGLPVDPLDRLANFSADDFERFVLEWADGYLRKKLPLLDDERLLGVRELRCTHRIHSSQPSSRLPKTLSRNDFIGEQIVIGKPPPSPLE
jgi:hypothetical protein